MFCLVCSLLSTGWTEETIEKTDFDTSDSGISIRLTYGPGGPARSMEQRSFFPGENICVSLRMPATLISSNQCDFENSYRLVHKTTGDIAHVTDFIPQKGELFKDDSPFFLQSGCRVPAVIDAGEYEFQVIVNDRLSRTQYKKSENVVILPETAFGLRNVAISHGISGTEQWVPGSNLFSVGEQVQISFGIGGLSVNAANEVTAMISLILTNEKGKAINFGESMPKLFPNLFSAYRTDPRDIGRVWEAWYRFSLNQSGKYILKITVQDLNAINKVLSYELPIHCVDIHQE
ncbi:MAG: hypothetical protein ACRCUY_03380 [Thermoguttaceae bacterium]